VTWGRRRRQGEEGAGTEECPSAARAATEAARLLKLLQPQVHLTPRQQRPIPCAELGHRHHHYPKTIPSAFARLRGLRRFRCIAPLPKSVKFGDCNYNWSSCYAVVLHTRWQRALAPIFTSASHSFTKDVLGYGTGSRYTPLPASQFPRRRYS